MERSLPNTEVPGIKSAHAMITDACRKRPFAYVTGAFGEASEKLWKAYRDVMAARKENDCADQTTYHLALSVEDHRHKPNQDVVLRTYIGGVRRKTDELTKDEARNVRHAARHLATYLTEEYKLDAPPESPGEEGEQDRRTPHGHPIRDAAEMEHTECPYPPDDDIQNDSSSTILETSTTELEDTGTIPARE